MQKLLAMFSLLQFLFLHISTTFDIFACITLRKHFIHRPFQWMKKKINALHCIPVQSLPLHKRRIFHPFVVRLLTFLACSFFIKSEFFSKRLRKYFDAKHNCVVNWILNFSHWASMCREKLTMRSCWGNPALEKERSWLNQYWIVAVERTAKAGRILASPKDYLHRNFIHIYLHKKHIKLCAER